MKNLVASCLIVVISFFTYSQEPEIDPLPSQLNSTFADSIIKKVLRPDTRIIVLGEENHGGELTNQINSIIINSLVTKYGFKTLVFESDFYGLLKADSLREVNTFRKNVHAAWSASVAFEKVEKLFLDGKLDFLGFDSRHHGELSQLHLIDYLKKHESDTSQFSEVFYTITESLLENEFKDTMLGRQNQEYFTYIDNWQSNRGDTTDLFYHVLINLKNYARQLLIESELGPQEYVAFRESAMIVNLDYILKNSTEKYIILGANLHIQPGFTGASQHASENVGDFIHEYYSNESVFILPIVYSGKTQNHSFPKPQKVSKKGKRKTIQRALSETNAFALVNYCYDSDYLLYPKAVQFKNIDFCGYFVFIREEEPRLFRE